MTHSKWVLIALFLILVGAFVWHNYHVVPNPVTLIFQRPSTNLSSLSVNGAWSMAGLDLEHTRYIPSPGPLPRGDLLWSTESDLLSGTSLPAVVDSTVYVGSRFNFLAIDAASGEVKWERASLGLVNSSPAVAGDMVYYGATDGSVWALDRQTGGVKWSYRTNGYVSSSPTISNGFLFVGSSDRHTYALDAETGQTIWKFRTQDHIIAAQSLHNGVLYFASTDGGIYSVNYRTGQARMRFRTSGISGTDAPVVANGLVYTAQKGGVLAIKAGIREVPGRYAFERLWRHMWVRNFSVPKPPLQHGYQWKFRPEGVGSFITAAPAVTGEAFYAGDLSGRLHARDALDAGEVWTFQADGPITSAPVVAGDIVFFGAQSGSLYALDRARGSLLWRLDLGAPIALSPSFAYGVLYVRTEDGRLHAVR